MVKETKSNQVLFEIKKERLKKHLDEEIPFLVSGWIGELSDIRQKEVLFRRPEHSRANFTKDEKTNHILRSHFRKCRNLWKNYADFQSELNKVDKILSKLKLKAGKIYKYNEAHTERYLETALERALQIKTKSDPDWNRNVKYYKYDIVESGITCGALIEKTTSHPSPVDLERIQKEHSKLAAEIAGTEEMKALSEAWGKTLNLLKKIEEIVQKQLDENRIFDKCRYCKALWD